MDIWEAWNAHRGRPLVKSSHFPEAYQRHLARFQGGPVVVAEIGVLLGGSLQLWKEYFGAGAQIYGIDVEPRCKQMEEDRIEILIGDQGDRGFLEHVARTLPPIDVLIDDGGHRMEQQILTFDVLFPKLTERGVYACEDTSSSYLSSYGGGFRRRGSFIERMKDVVDDINAWYSEDAELVPNDLTRTVASLHFYSGLVVVEKGAVEAPQFMVSNGEEVYYPRSAQPVLDGVRSRPPASSGPAE